MSVCVYEKNWVQEEKEKLSELCTNIYFYRAVINILSCLLQVFRELLNKKTFSIFLFKYNITTSLVKKYFEKEPQFTGFHGIQRIIFRYIFGFNYLT